MRQFKSNTFVCFIDISGFKHELGKDPESAARMLDTFYSAGYNALKEYQSLNGIFVSDCGIIFSTKGDIASRIDDLLGAVKFINQIMLQSGWLTTTSIAYGYLEYKRKFIFDRIKKNAILGNGYLNAFLDNECIEPKLKPGEVRITKNLDQAITKSQIFGELNFSKSNTKLLREEKSHFYYDWICSDKFQRDKVRFIYKIFDDSNSNDRFDKLKIDLKKILAK